MKEKYKIINALELPYSNAKLEASNSLIKKPSSEVLSVFRILATLKLEASSFLISKKRKSIQLSPNDRFVSNYYT